MSVRAALRDVALRLPDVEARACWGEEGFFHAPHGGRRRLFLTLREDPSRVPGEGRLRVSLPLPRATYLAWFGAPPARPRSREARLGGPTRGAFRPHPLYAWNAWAQAWDPGPRDLPALADAVREAYGRVVEAP